MTEVAGPVGLGGGVLSVRKYETGPSTSIIAELQVRRPLQYTYRLRQVTEIQKLR